MPLTRIFVRVVAPLLCLCFAVGVSAQQQPSNPRRARRYGISGTVRDAINQETLTGVEVDLRALSGGTMATVFTSGNGSFEFDAIAPGNYFIDARMTGYQALTQSVDMANGPVIGLQVELRKPGDEDAISGPPVVSARELSIPRKAHDALQKGMKLLYGKGDFQGSVAQFQRAIQAYPDYYEAYAQVGVAYMKLGNTSGAEQALHQSLQMNDRYVDGYTLLAMLFGNNRRFADAEPLARKAVQLDPNSFQANYELSRGLYGLDRPQEAEQSALAAVNLRPDDASIRLLLANIHLKLRNIPAMLEDLDAYLKLDPSGPQAERARETRDKLRQALSNGQATPAPPHDSEH
jgi:tetratricopeptide (TPR) repeat protein